MVRIKAKTVTQGRLDKVKDMVALIKSGRTAAKQYAAEVTTLQEETIPLLLELGAHDRGVTFVNEKGEEEAAFVQQNDPPQFWDQTEVIEWCKNNGHWGAVSIEVFDQSRFEDLIARGLIRSASVAKFKKTGDAPKPFVRFGKPKEDSL